MIKPLNGKIIWVSDDFGYRDELVFVLEKDKRKDNIDYYYHAASRIENFIMDDNMIRFTTNYISGNEVTFSYIFNLNRDVGDLYKGVFYDESEPGDTIDITIEKFENNHGLLLKGAYNNEGDFGTIIIEIKHQM
ncbi:hypothetical protein ACV07N_15750 [Roseivirga echinicomitans]